jgi:hypothetical protein
VAVGSSEAQRNSEVFHFPWIYSNVNQIQFSLNWISSKFVKTECLNGFHSSHWIQI